MEETDLNNLKTVENMQNEATGSSQDSIPKINVRFDGTNWLNKNLEGQPICDEVTETVAEMETSSHPGTSKDAGDKAPPKASGSEGSSGGMRAEEEADAEFEPSVESMIHEFDDESTLEEDEVGAEEDEEELGDLAKEGEMPLEDLLKMYYGNQQLENKSEKDTGTSSDSENEKSQPVENKQAGGPPRKLRSNNVLMSPIHHDSGEEEDGDYAPEDWRKSPRIGDDYQVESIPSKEKQGPDYNCEGDELVWNPYKIGFHKVEQYLSTVSQINSSNAGAALPCGSHLRDNEDALLLLQQCDNDTDEAAKQYKWRPPALSSELHVWSEAECKSFEHGLALYGKDFHLIHQNKVATKSIGEIVKFYYIWKKTERYANFNAKTRLGKKKDLMHPGVTDYMERLLDETENTIGNSSSHHLNIGHSSALQQHLSALRVTRSNLRQEASPTNYSDLNGLLDSDFVDDIEMFDGIVPMTTVPAPLTPNLNSINPSVTLPEIDPAINIRFRDHGGFAPYPMTSDPFSNRGGQRASPSFNPTIVTSSQAIVDPARHSFRPLNPAETTSSVGFVSSSSEPLGPGLSSFTAVSSTNNQAVKRDPTSKYNNAPDSTSALSDLSGGKRGTETPPESDAKRQRLYEESDSNSSTEASHVTSTSNLRRAAAASNPADKKRADGGDFSDAIAARDAIADSSRLVKC